MSGNGNSPVHYEVFSRKTPQAAWSLQMATEERTLALQTAEEMLATSRAAAVRVTKEVFDAASGEFSSVTLMTKGLPEVKKKMKLAPETDTVCTSPQDLYSVHAREKIGRLLEDWLRRYKVTPFELLHRPDLAEKLDASGTELQHVVQKLAIPESQETGQDLHDLMRRWRALIDRALTRLIEDGKKKLFPDIDLANWLGTIDKLNGHAERAYVLGGAIAKVLAQAGGPAAKLERLLAFARALSQDLGGREWAMPVIEVAVSELFGAKTALNEILGYEADLGDSLAVMTRMAAGPEVDRFAAIDPRVARVMPALPDALEGFHNLMARDCFPTLSVNISRRLMTELKGPRRLKPGNPEGEIETLRALALCLTAAGKEETQRDDIKEAFAERSRMLVSADFVESLMSSTSTPAEEIERLIWLCENVVGGANKRQAARWLISALGALKFERDMRETSTPAGQRLQTLANMQKRVRQIQLTEKDEEDASTRLGQVGAMVASDANLIANLARASAGGVQKIGLLLSFATGVAAPLGPVSDQARSEILKLLRVPDIRREVMINPQLLAALKPILHTQAAA